MKTLVALIFLSAAFAFTAFSEEDDHHHGEAHEHEEGNVGPGKAVTKASPDKGFQLSEAAIRTLGIKTIVVEDPANIPSDALIHYQDMVGVYWLHDGWFKLIRPKRLEPGDQIVTSGADYLRIVELDLFTEDVEGHQH